MKLSSRLAKDQKDNQEKIQIQTQKILIMNWLMERQLKVMILVYHQEKVVEANMNTLVILPLELTQMVMARCLNRFNLVE